MDKTYNLPFEDFFYACPTCFKLWYHNDEQAILELIENKILGDNK